MCDTAGAVARPVQDWTMREPADGDHARRRLATVCGHVAVPSLRRRSNGFEASPTMDDHVVVWLFEKKSRPV